MPTTNKRINLTVPEDLYQRICTYKKKYGISSDAAACLQLVVRQLDSIEQSEQMLALVSRLTTDQLRELSNIGLETLKSKEG